jgi:ABC-type branched-subunit amino acid transport system ATPase component/ABC-type branched-subunit amino acid transport system permease subunit
MRFRQIALLMVALVFAASPLFGIPAWTLALATVVAFTAISLIGLNLIYGLTGMLSLGQAAFAAWPVYLAGICHANGVPWSFAIPAAVVATVILAQLIGSIFIRLPGIYFAIGTLGFAFVTEGLARAFPGITGGASGLVLVLPFRPSPLQWYLFSLVALGIGLALYRRLTTGASYRVLRIIRHDELSAEVLGVNVAKTKLRIFMIGATYSAVSGILLAFFIGIIVPENGGVNMSLEHLATTIIGGAGSLLGPIIGAFAVQWLFAVAGAAEKFELLLYGSAFFVIVLYAPQGITGLAGRRLQRLFGLADPKTGDRQTSGRPGVADATAHAEGTATGAGKADQVCLAVRDVTKQFGGLVAVDQVSLTVNHGQILALIGPNGAGKSTLFNIINGIERPDSGSVEVQGKQLLGTPIHQLAVKTGRSFQTPRLVPEMTVLHNVATRLDNVSGAGDEDARIASSYQQLVKYGLEKYADEPVHKVGIGSHKLIDVARSSVGAPPLLLLDEPAVGLTEDEVRHLAAMLNRLKNAGTAILLVEHNFEFVKTVADSIVVLDGGKVIAVGSVAEVMNNPKVQEAYFGALA